MKGKHGGGGGGENLKEDNERREKMETSAGTMRG